MSFLSSSDCRKDPRVPHCYQASQSFRMGNGTEANNLAGTRDSIGATLVTELLHAAFFPSANNFNYCFTYDVFE